MRFHQKLLTMVSFSEEGLVKVVLEVGGVFPFHFAYLKKKKKKVIRGCLGFPDGSDYKESACSADTRIQSLGQEDPLEKGMTTQSSILAWRIPWTEEPGGLQSMGSQSDTTEAI